MRQRLTARDILDRLVAFPTVSRDSNLDLIDWVEDYLDGFGVPARRVYNDDRTKAAIYANVGPTVDGGIVLSGHTDVVPVDGQDWDTDPFTVVEKDGRLYGRGTCDMKGFDALALAAVPLALDAGVTRPLQIALSYDEEIGCTGAPPMIDDMRAHLPRASAVVVGEPSMMKIVTGHKGGVGYDVHVRGFEVHSSIMHRGVNAIMEAAKIIDWANRQNSDRSSQSKTEIARMFDPPWTTTHVGQIAGGTAHNITAADCRFGLDFRIVADERAEDWEERFLAEVARVETEIRSVCPEAGITVTPRFDVPPLRPEDQGRAEEIARRASGDNGSSVVSYGTEAGHFQDRGYSAVICGPGDIAQAHQQNEFISNEQFADGERFIQRIISILSSNEKSSD